MLDIFGGLLLRTLQPLPEIPSVIQTAEAYYEQPAERAIEQTEQVNPVAYNCYLYVSQRVQLPLMARVVPNTTPFVGSVAIFQYNVKHIAYVEKLTEKGFYIAESNYRPGVIGTRFIPWDYDKLTGFYAPSDGSLAMKQKRE